MVVTAALGGAEETMTTHQGRHFLQIPGPSPVPDRVLRAMDMPVIDHRSPAFAELAKAVFEGSRKIFKTSGPVIIFPSSGTGDWRHGADPADIEARLAQDTSHAIKAVMVVHNETSTGVTSRVGEIRAAMDRVGHPALLMVDTISSLGSVDYRHDEWKVDVTVSGSQTGFMLPPGLGFNAISEEARAAAQTNRL